VGNGAGGAVLPVTSRLPQFNGASHAVFDAFGVFPGVPLGMMTHKDRLSHWDPVRDSVNGFVRLVGVVRPAFAVVVEPLRTLFGPFGQAGVLVADFAAQFQKQILSVRGPHGRDEKVLFRCPNESRRAYAVV
jgi:hypothetical protein